MPILIGADVGGTKTAVGVSEGGGILARADGPGAAVRPGRALASAGMIAEVVRRALANLGRLSGDVLLVRTGRWRWRAEHGPWDPRERLAGLHASCLPWLHERINAGLVDKVHGYYDRDCATPEA